MNGAITIRPGSTATSALQAAHQGAHDARLAAERFLPAAARFVGGCIYQTGYAISFGIVFPATLATRVVPMNNPMALGFADGAHAAVDLARESKGLPLSPPRRSSF